MMTPGGWRPRKYEMIWIFVAAAVIGLFAGCVFRAGALLILSGLAAMAIFGFLAVEGYSILAALGIAFGGMATLQLGFLIGVWLSSECTARCWSGRLNRKDCNIVFWAISYVARATIT